MDILISKEGVHMIWTFGITLCTTSALLMSLVILLFKKSWRQVITLAVIILFLIGVAVQHAYKDI